jgi:hypothetical protein
LDSSKGTDEKANRNDIKDILKSNLNRIPRRKMSPTETFRPAFTSPPATHLVGIPTENLKLSSPYISYGLPYYESCAKHVRHTFKCSRVYIIASGTLARTTDKVDKLVSAIGQQNVVGVRKGMTPHTPWSDILEITAEVREAKGDCVVTLGAGSTTDGAKIVVLVAPTSGSV